VSVRTVHIAAALSAACPRMRVGIMEASVVNRGPDAELRRRMEETAEKIRSGCRLEDIARHPVIAATRAAYKACGKDPSRYRPSAESLRRRVVKGAGLYYISLVVDLINHLSLRTGFSISAFDAEKVEGAISWDVGRPGEVIESIGRGTVNAAGLPVIRDERGIIGSPTTDSARTCITEGTRRVLVTAADFAGSGPLEDLLEEAGRELGRQARAGEMRIRIIAAS